MLKPVAVRYEAVDPQKLYFLPVFKRVTGLGDKAIRMARAGGLRVISKHGRAAILGADFIRYWTNEPVASPTPANESDH
jgi:hypothetical protein